MFLLRKLAFAVLTMFTLVLKVTQSSTKESLSGSILIFTLPVMFRFTACVCFYEIAKFNAIAQLLLLDSALIRIVIIILSIT